MIIDSGEVNDKTYLGGRVGVLVFSQEKVIWSNVVYRCNGKTFLVADPREGLGGLPPLEPQNNVGIPRHNLHVYI